MNFPGFMLSGEMFNCEAMSLAESYGVVFVLGAIWRIWLPAG